MTPQSQLPEVPATPSALIRAAIAEARRLDPSVYQPKYHTWHSSDPAACFICDAGAVVAGTLIPASESFTVNTSCYPNYFPHAWEQALHAIDAARCGYIGDALAYLQRAHDPGAPFDPAAFSEINDAVLEALGPNCNATYTDWPTFNAHLAYMERLAEHLDTINC
ncbi:MAG: hypothetical protein OXH14_08805 [Alphaproteobacteria bacterium]|nr:hypothetical protein [Alphaproteobacteria bacterium]